MRTHVGNMFQKRVPKSVGGRTISRVQVTKTPLQVLWVGYAVLAKHRGAL
jgi:hypothetical protein